MSREYQYKKDILCYQNVLFFSMSPFTHIDTIETPEANLRPPSKERKMYFIYKYPLINHQQLLYLQFS